MKIITLCVIIKSCCLPKRNWKKENECKQAVQWILICDPCNAIYSSEQLKLLLSYRNNKKFHSKYIVSYYRDFRLFVSLVYRRGESFEHWIIALCACVSLSHVQVTLNKYDIFGWVQTIGHGFRNECSKCTQLTGNLFEKSGQCGILWGCIISNHGYK